MSSVDPPEWFSLVSNLKGKLREGWARRGMEGDTIAEHCFGSDFVTWILASEAGCDVGHALQLSVIHELVMGMIPDATPASNAYVDKPITEEEAIPQLLELLPQQMRGRFEELWREFREQDTLESRIAREAAKLETMFYAEQLANSDSQLGLLADFINTYTKEFRSEIGQRHLERVSDRHVARSKVNK